MLVPARQGNGVLKFDRILVPSRVGGYNTRHEMRRIMDLKTERDFVGYGGQPPHAAWPGDARVAVQFVLNYEEGGERSVTDGDAHAETFLSEIIGANPYPARHMSMESMYEYGARAGFWRIHRLFRECDLPVTVYGVAVALARNPDVVEAMLNADWDIACHGYRWLDYQFVEEAIERAHIEQAIELHTKIVGSKPLGWYTGRDSPNTRRLIWSTTTSSMTLTPMPMTYPTGFQRLRSSLGHPIHT